MIGSIGRRSRTAVWRLARASAFSGILAGMLVVTNVQPTMASACSTDYGWYFDAITPGTQALTTVWSTTDDNWSSFPATFSVTNTVTAAVSATVSVSVAVSVGFLVGEVKESLGVSVSQSITTSISHSASITIPGKHWVTFRYGVFRTAYTGHLYYVSTVCTVTKNYGRITVYGPTHQGWSVSTGSL